MVRFIKYAFFFILFSLGIWYFLIKDYNYKITFTTTQIPAIVYINLTTWNDGHIPDQNIVTTIKKTPYSEVQQKYKLDDTILNIKWILEKNTDSTTLVTAKIKDENHSFKQNLQVLFYKNAFAKSSLAAVERFGKSLLNHAETYKVSSVVKAKIPSQHYAYISLESKSQKKASTMLKNISVITDYIKGNEIALTGHPFLEITEWDSANDILKFNFCFPIEKREQYPETDVISFKKTTERNALRAIFNGNYRNSDRAWYVIMDYAYNNNIAIEHLPVEIFLNDPHEGRNPLEWEAEIYMPIND